VSARDHTDDLGAGAPPAVQPASLPPIVDGEWVASHLEALLLADVRWYLDGRPGRDAYLNGHLPGAVWVDLDTDLSDTPSEAAGRHPLPNPARFAQALGQLGIGDDDLVVAYDDQGGGFAARMVWMLRVLGQQAALLDGGLSAWPGALEVGDTTRQAKRRVAQDWPARLIRDADQMHSATSSPGSLILDARANDRYTGAQRLPAESRTGHIPAARSAPWSENLAPDGSFRTPQELLTRFERLGATGADEVIVYCGSGVTACHDLLALEYAGLPAAALYPGSWSAWSADPSRPVATGDEPMGRQTV
jgi:thiosulfate/3-mercaptopyruvate sulfurtransferase